MQELKRLLGERNEVLTRAFMQVAGIRLYRHDFAVRLTKITELVIELSWCGHPSEKAWPASVAERARKLMRRLAQLSTLRRRGLPISNLRERAHRH